MSAGGDTSAGTAASGKVSSRVSARATTTASSVLLSHDEVEALTEIFDALSDPTRLRILYAIAAHERSVGEISTLLALSQPSVSQHLRRLRSLRVVRLRREGRRHFYQLDDDHVATLLGVSRSHVRGG